MKIAERSLPPPPPPPPVSTRTGGADPATGEVRYLALGDSISAGGGLPDPERASFPARLAARWREAGCTVTLKNLGVSRFTAADVIRDQLPQIEAFAPTLVTVQVGSNDVATKVPLATYRAEVRAILDAATRAGARVLVLGQNEWFRAPDGPSYGGTFEKREAFDAVLFEEARRHDAELVDLRSLYRRQADAPARSWSADGIHPTASAYDEMAAEIARVVPAPSLRARAGA
ncbi:MAG: SGNH/GDSL hydrolase family protein [Labilithrix sp.]|nr:SGNH/GDSL hydrolase family protein [Labilithrix sp.]MCW5815774.1 SGNH/GDSL hydrolase family protein [Labilithrix sp.]